MREHIRDMIDRVQSEDRSDARRQQELPLRLASEAMRMAHLAVSVHMMLAARMRVEADSPSSVEPPSFMQELLVTPERSR